METVISFTPAQLILWASALITIASAFGVIFNLASKLKEPENKQNARIKGCEEKLEKHDRILEKYQQYFTNDDKRFKEIEQGNRMMQTALLALLKNALNDGDKSTLKEAEKSLEDYLINK